MSVGHWIPPVRPWATISGFGPAIYSPGGGPITRANLPRHTDIPRQLCERIIKWKRAVFILSCIFSKGFNRYFIRTNDTVPTWHARSIGNAR